MLPPPFNLIPAMFAIFHYSPIFIQFMAKKLVKASEGEANREDLPIATNATDAATRPAVNDGPLYVHNPIVGSRQPRAPYNRELRELRGTPSDTGGFDTGESKASDPTRPTLLSRVYSRNSLTIFPEQQNSSVPESTYDEHNTRSKSSHICSCDCKYCKAYETHRKTDHSQFLSISGTASDITLGLLVLFPCALYEIYLCLREIWMLQKRKDLIWICLAISILGFPFFYVGFVITLLVELVQLRTELRLNKKGEYEVCYGLDDAHVPETTPDIVMDPAKFYTCLSVKVIRAELEGVQCLLGSQLSRTANLYVVVKIGEQVLVTPTVKCNDKKAFFDATKEFKLCCADEDMQDRTVQLSLYDDHALQGECVVPKESFSKWIANERFEGDLDLHLNLKRVGTVSIAAQRKHTHLTPQSEPVAGVVEEPFVLYTSVSAYVLLSRCVALEKMTFHPTSEYIIKLTLGDNSVETLVPVATPDGTTLRFDELLRIRMASAPSDKLDTMLSIELLKRRLQSSCYDTVATRITRAEFLVDEEFDGKLEMYNGLKCVCNIELLATVSNETFKKTNKRVSTQDQQGIDEDVLGKCSCGKAILHTCRALRKRRTKLFSKDDIEKIFLGVEANQSSVTKGEFSYELRQEIKRAGQDQLRVLEILRKVGEANKLRIKIDRLRKAMYGMNDVLSREMLSHKLETYLEEYVYYRSQILSNDEAYFENYGKDLIDLNSTTQQ